LGRLRRDPTNEKAWGEFVDVYAPKIMGWCQKWNMQDADAQDVTQEVLVKLAEKLRYFMYDPSKSFRAWLKTVAQHTCSDFMHSKNRPGVGSGRQSRRQAALECRGARDLVLHLEQEFDREILEEAMLHIRLRVAPQTWQAFWLTAVGGACPELKRPSGIPMQVGAGLCGQSDRVPQRCFRRRSPASKGPVENEDEP